MDFFNFDGDLLLVFAFVIAIILIGNIFSVQRNRDRQKTIRELAASGKELSPETIRALGLADTESGSGIGVGGAVLLGVAFGLVVLGQAIGYASGDDEVPVILAGVAAIPGAIGLVLIISRIFIRRDRNGD
ncbi:MAG: hypothetical protein AAFV51_00695 [Pseudomonadota bacterium]